MKFKPGRETKSLMNDSNFRQAENNIKLHTYENISSQYYDKTVDILVRQMIEAINEEIKESQDHQPLEPESFVERYGVDLPGFINFGEFREMYKIHVHYADDNNYTKEMPEDE